MTTSKTTFRRMLAENQKDWLIVPIIRAELLNPKFKGFTLKVEAWTPRPYDGKFHPSTHALWSPRQLALYLTRPDALEEERLSLVSVLAITQGKFWHTFVQRLLLRHGILLQSEIPLADPETNVVGHMDGMTSEYAGFEFKALDCATPILTRTGWSTMGELVEGDEVYAPDGTLTKVTGAHPIRHGRSCYEVRLRDGQSVVADAEHLWQVVDLRDHRNVRERVVTTQQLVDEGVRHRRGFRFAVPVTAPLQADEVELPIDPWLLGAWLGDGARHNACITSGEQDLSCLRERLDALGLSYRVTSERTAWRVYIHGLRPLLRKLGVLGNKHIPEAYLSASEDQRRALLAGLMDTDGSVGGHQVSIGMVNEALMRQVLQLVRSLGYRATWNCHRARLNGADAGPVYWVKFSGTHSRSPFAMPRKTSRFDEIAGTQRIDLNAIVAVTEVETRPTRCITVAHESSLYVVGRGFVPTHNTMNDWKHSKIRTWQDFRDLEPGYYAQAQDYLRITGLSAMRVVIMGMANPYPMTEVLVPADEMFQIQQRRKYQLALELAAEQEIGEQCCNIHSARSKSCLVRFACPIGTRA